MKIINKDDLKTYLLLFGFSDEYDIYDLDEEIAKYISHINRFKQIDFRTITPPSITRSDVFNRTKSFLKSLFKLSNIKRLTNTRLKTKLKNNNCNSLGELVELYNFSHDDIPPFSLPVHFNEEETIYGLLLVQYLPIEDKKTFYEVIKYLNICFVNIVLSKKVNDLTTSFFAHEIMHTQFAEKGIIENIYNSEVVSIFVELLYAYTKNKTNYSFLIAHRINHISLVFTKMYNEGESKGIYNYCIWGKYIVSTIKAFNLLDRYINGSIQDKKDIIKNIQKVIDKERTLEDTLDRLDISYDNSTDPKIVKRIIK